MECKGLEARRQFGKNLKEEMKKIDTFGLGVKKLRWEGQGEISGDYTVSYSGGERAERCIAIMDYRSIARSVVKEIVCNDRVNAVKLKAESENILIVQVYRPTSEYEDAEVEKLYDATEEILAEDG